eukprot:CAMPEP_0173103196 /NCGR_PEP_ID=MMETSP1102-20130122/38179_1 /TAXON_ID=49646 /ORGANISM="Geminigera sp., Strain Caron Lab Isolate" /LENGTH=30 /DNA_ID= /DNA_START= /DNA_END= /DNA_ORIENTATION=
MAPSCPLRRCGTAKDEEPDADATGEHRSTQ